MTRASSFVAAAALSATTAFGGGGPLNVLVVVNDQSPESLEAGRYYAEKRGVPERNMFHVSTTTNYAIDTAAFSNEIRGPVLGYIVSAGLSNQIDYIAIARGVPHRVSQPGGSNGLTSAMFYDFKNGPICDNPGALSRSDYYEAERAFRRAGSPSSNRYYIASMLTAWNLDQTKRLIDRSVAADASFPQGSVYFVWTSEVRMARWTQYEEADFPARFVTGAPARVFHYGALVQNETNVAGYMVGQVGVPFLDSNTYVPGALADHLTSEGGMLFDSPQMSILEWIRAGCAGSYGTVLEPCLALQKFPHAKLHYWYGRGFTMGESYMMSLRNPYQGGLVGDPLCAPFSAGPAVAVSGLASGQTVNGIANIAITGSQQSARSPVRAIDLYLDGLHATNLVTLNPLASNTVAFTYNGSSRNYSAPPGMDAFRMATGLAARINAFPDLGITAQALGDRVEIVQDAMGVAGASNSLSVSAEQGVATQLTLAAWTPFTNLVETVYAAKEGVELNGTPLPGDRVRVVVTNLAGVGVTNEIVATTNDTTAFTLMTNVMAVINGNAALMTPQGCYMGFELDWLACCGQLRAEAWFVARTNTWEGRNLFLSWQVIPTNTSTLTGPNFSDNFNDNGAVLSARGEIFIASGRATVSVSHALNTSLLPDGPHELTVVAEDGTGVAAQRRVTIPFVVDNNSVTCRVVRPPNGHHAPRGSAVTVEVAAATGAGSVTQVTLFVEGKAFAATSAPPYEWVWVTTNYGAGSIGVQARADTSAGESCMSEIARVVLFTDGDGDGVSDQWEYQHLGSMTNHDGSADPDGDGLGNRDEYLADTDPTNVSSFLAVTRISATGGVVSLEFEGRTTRVYRIGLRDGSLTNGPGWAPASNVYFGVSGAPVVWNDDPTNAPPATTNSRAYRVEAAVP